MGRNAANIRKGNAALRGLKQRLQGMPVTLAVEVASRAGPALTDLAQEAHGSRRNVYGDAYPIGAEGKQLTLQRTGAVAEDLRFVASGTIVAAKLSEPYAKYLIGKYNVLPNGALPAGWKRELDTITHDVKVPL